MLKPFISDPIFVAKVWGGRALESQFGKTLPDKRPFGESWEVADLPDGTSNVASGEFAGRSLASLVDQFGAELCGVGHTRFPLLIKFLDAQADLSVQVHPGRDDLHRHPGAQLKDETWYFLGGNGVVYHGLEPGVSKADLHDAIDNKQDVTALLRSFHPAPGDALRVSPGTVHAIGADVALLEIQTPSNTTYRVWDYDRPGIDGEPRELHVEQAIDVIRESNDETLRTDRDALVVKTEHYSIHRFSGEGLWQNDRCGVVVNVGTDALELDDLMIPRFCCAVVPACVTAVHWSGSGVVCWA